MAQDLPKTLVHKYAHILHYAWRQWPAFLLIVALTSASAVVGALQPWPMKILVDYALGTTAIPPSLSQIFISLSLHPTPSTLVTAAALAGVGLFALNSALDVGLSWAWAAAGQRMVYDLAADLFHRLQRLSQLFHQQRSVGDSLSRLTEDTWCVYTLTDSLLITPCQQLITLATIGVVAWHLDNQLALLSLLVGPSLGASALFFGRRLKHRARLNREAQSRLLSFVQQTLTAIPIVQAFRTQPRNSRQFQHLTEEVVTISQRNTLILKSYGLANGFFMTCGAAIILFFGGQRILAGSLSTGSLLVFLAYLKILHNAAQLLLSNYGSVKSVEASLDRVLEILGSDESVQDRPTAQALAPRTSGSGRHGPRVVFEEVTFGYEAGRPVLEEVNLEAQPGQMLALVGATGAGKSTLVSLLPRFFDPWSGRITFDGTDLRDITLDSLRAQVALVLQTPFLLPLTIAENIAYGRPSASREDIEAAALAANAHAFIQNLPHGYDTILGERGGGLSGGEQQRLSIARALLKDAPLLVLDEPTSALDAHTEALLLQALHRLMQGRTTFIIAHRLSTIQKAHRILVLDQGRIIQAGSHQQLMDTSGLYHHLHRAQFGDTLREVRR